MESETPRQLPTEAILEALLFAHADPLPNRRILDILEDLDEPGLAEVVERLNARLEETGRPLIVREIAGGYQMFTRPEYHPWLTQLVKASNDKVTTAGLETLAIIAYKQPLTRADVESIRGVQSGQIIRTLLDFKLVKITGRAEVIGRPLLYGTTRRFLDQFGLGSLKDLPTIEELQQLVRAEDEVKARAAEAEDAEGPPIPVDQILAPDLRRRKKAGDEIGEEKDKLEEALGRGVPVDRPAAPSFRRDLFLAGAQILRSRERDLPEVEEADVAFEEEADAAAAGEWEDAPGVSRPEEKGLFDDDPSDEPHPNADSEEEDAAAETESAAETMAEDDDRAGTDEGSLWADDDDLVAFGPEAVAGASDEQESAAAEVSASEEAVIAERPESSTHQKPVAQGEPTDLLSDESEEDPDPAGHPKQESDSTRSEVVEAAPESPLEEAQDVEEPDDIEEEEPDSSLEESEVAESSEEPPSDEEVELEPLAADPVAEPAQQSDADDFENMEPATEADDDSEAEEFELEDEQELPATEDDFDEPFPRVSESTGH
ncbi:MAG: SMC-Scp complex subunit ScpB [Planctomycetota bacterium]